MNVIPDGWYLLKTGNLIKPGDKFWSEVSSKWVLSGEFDRPIGEFYTNFDYIRKQSEQDKMMKLNTIDGNYELNFTRALALGVLTRIKTKRPLKFMDLNDGDVFKFRNVHNNPAQWERELFKMVDKNKNGAGQCVSIVSDNSLKSGYPTWFGNAAECEFAILQNDGGWKIEIED